MKNKGVTNKMFLPLTVAVILLALITPAIGIDHPVEPFQKAKAMALLEGRVIERENGKMYVLTIEGWGTITYSSWTESIMLWKGTPNNNVGVIYYGKSSKYSVSRRIEGSESETTNVDWSVAMDIAYKYLQEIEAVRSKK